MVTLLVDVWQKLGLDRDAHTPDKFCCVGIDRGILPGLMLTVDGPRQRWQTVLFTDKSKFNLSYSDGRRRVFRRTGERYADCCVVEVNRFGGGGLMVWAGIGGTSRRTCI